METYRSPLWHRNPQSQSGRASRAWIARVTLRESFHSGTWSVRTNRYVPISCRNVHAVGEPGRADPAGRQQHVDAAARAQVQDPLALVQVRDRQRVTAAQAGQNRLLGQPVGLPVTIVATTESGV